MSQNEKRSFGKPRKRWFDDVENDPKKTYVTEAGEKQLGIDTPGN
jgi:hypothetical protein